MLTSPMRPVLLGIDTSTDQAGIGLANGDSFAELSWPAGRSQTTTLLTAIDRLLGMNDLTLDQIGAVAVATGPGTFTGLRVGLSIAKGFVLARDLPLIGIPTLAVTAYPYQALGVAVMATLPAGRGRVVWAISEHGGTLGAPTNSTLAELVDVLVRSPDLLVAGELLSAHREAIAAVHDRIETASLNGRRPSVLAQLAWERWRAGDVDDPALLEPTYVHGRQTALPPRSQR